MIAKKVDEYGEFCVFLNSIQPDSSVLNDLKAEHLSTLSAPLDAYWEEALIGFSDHYEITMDGARCGFFCINSENQLMAFFLSRKFAKYGRDYLSEIIREYGVKKALVGTNDSYFLSLCLDVLKSCKVHSFLFQDNQDISDELPAIERFSFELSGEGDFVDIFEHYCAASGSVDMESVESGFEDLKGYIRSVMGDHHIFVLRENGELVATSECRVSRTQEPYADVGMIVAEKHRRKGLGSYVLARTKDFCYERHLKPICSCEVDNIGSQKAITRAGFVSRHRILEIELGV